jgi:two-component system, NarL family, nitrate/nitrite response regulator NarL
MRTILADGEPSVRHALRLLLTQHLGVQVVGEVGGAGPLQRRVEEEQPDLLVVAWNLVADNAPAAFAALRRSSPGLHIVVLGLRPETQKAAVAAGADGFVSKVDPPEEVVRALRAWDQALRDGAVPTEPSRASG